MASRGSSGSDAMEVKGRQLILDNLPHDVNLTYFNTLLDNTTTPDANGSDASATAERVGAIQFVLYGVLGNVLAVFGLLGNAMSIVVLCNRRMRSSTSYYLISLAVYDNVILLSMIFFFNLPALAEQTPAMSRYRDYLLATPVVYPVSLAAQMGSIYTCVAFTVERFIAVCRPLHAANTCTKSRAKKIILFILLWAALYNVPRYFQYDVQRHVDNATGQSQPVVIPTDFGNSELFQHVYIIYFQLFFMFLLPFLLILVLNAALMRAISRSRSTRQQMSTSATREHNLTVMLVAVILAFLVCQFPTIVDNILVAVVGFEQHGKIFEFMVFTTVCTCMVTINASLNFVLYCLFGKKFRLVLLHILGLKAAKKEYQYRSTLYQSRTNGTRLTTCSNYDMEVSLV